MITLFGQTFRWNDPEMLLLAGVAVVLLGFLLLILRSTSRSATAAEPLLREIGWLSSRLQHLGDGQPFDAVPLAQSRRAQFHHQVGPAVG